MEIWQFCLAIFPATIALIVIAGELKKHNNKSDEDDWL
jgi:hypothetical protein|tara:strand:- start:52 stop:165 length:114 start_codon:yes stop_codon:yes gene_type:complete